MAFIGYQSGGVGGAGLAGDASAMLLDQAEQQLGVLEDTAREIEHGAAAINTADDTSALRERLRQLRSDATALIKNIASALRQPVSQSEKPRYDRILSRLQVTVSQCKSVSELSIQRERAFPNPRGLNSFRPNEVMMESPVQGRSGFQDLQLTERTEMDVDNQIIRERNTEMQRINSELQQLTGVFVDASRLVNEDREYLMQAEDNVLQTEFGTKATVKIINKAASSQRASRYKLMCIILILITLIVLVALFVAFVLGLFKKLGILTHL